MTDQVWGMAYKISEEDQEKVMAHLDHREKDGYHRADSNPFYTGPTNEDTIADIIASAVGPSGPNSEYLFQLAEAMRVVGASDTHLFSIETKVKNSLGVCSNK
ncbi:glutathione-specific gamma-glutamylcyclotransferase 2-like 2 [Homarus americanus]|uniref:glutathione-specific gamma-glutamylcyclotransferase n=1 Tax=Homarus americanus TaxID=6706 RepID=A0A8J5JZF9_HOMAM|nr:glutathione-specific gamma-glutamylcyclotransferase 2-like 2 [Homarus americanus]